MAKDIDVKITVEVSRGPCGTAAIGCEVPVKFPADLREVYKRLGKVWEARHA